MQIEIIPIRSDFLRDARLEGLDDQRQKVKKLTAKGGEPCRDVLRRALPGEELILASYCPFERGGPYREFGPVFILATDGNEEPCLTALPLAGANGAESYLRDSFVLRAYNAAEEIVDARLVSPETVEQTIEELFAAEETAFIHARFPTYGCYGLRVDRR
jgi:hypothetical protein